MEVYSLTILSLSRAALPLLNYMTLPFSNSLHARSVSSKFCNPGGPLKKKRFLFVRFGLWGWLGWSLFWFWFWWHRRACRWDMVGLDQGWEGDFSHKCQGRLDSLVEGTSHVHDGDFFFFFKFKLWIASPYLHNHQVLTVTRFGVWTWAKLKMSSSPWRSSKLKYTNIVSDLNISV